MEGCGDWRGDDERGGGKSHGTSVDVIQFQPLSKGVLLTALIDSVSLSTSLNFVIVAIFVLRLTVNKRLDDSYRDDARILHGPWPRLTVLDVGDDL